MEATDGRYTQQQHPTGNLKMNVHGNHDPSRFSYYMTDEFYTALVSDFSDWLTDDRVVGDTAERDQFRSILEKEARLLDQLLFEEWLGLFVPECAYWVPSTRNQGDPRSEIAVMFDDRRRLEDRVFRMRTGNAWSQAPASRTTRMISNVEVFQGRSADLRMVRCNFLISEFWYNETRILTGWAGYRMSFGAADWKISAKQINLINCDQCIRNPSIIL
jgi:3-phenylpropionate/cinnamic acid dioxygenase small subunit